MDIFDKPAVVDGTVLEVMQTCIDMRTFLAGIMAIGKNNNICTMQAESFELASVSFDQGFQILAGWN